MTKAIKRIPALAFPEIDISDAAALKAINLGTATPEQQKRGMDWVLKRACNVGGISFDTEALIMAFNEGKEFVGKSILFVLNEPIAKFDNKPKRRA